MCMEKQTAETASYHVGRLINMVSHQLKRQMNAPEDEDGLTNMQKLILHHILFESMNYDLFQKDIEKEFEIRRSTATGILQLLEKNGFIIRKSVEQDARLKKIVPTQKAVSLRQQIIGNICYMEALLRKKVAEEDLKVCVRVLEQMSENLLGNEKEIKKGENQS